MSSKKSIVVVIDNFIRGGAETLLVGILKELAYDYYLVVVTLDDRNEFAKEDITCDELYSLRYTGKRSFIPAVARLRTILRRVKPHLIHAHLLNSSQIARLANAGSKIPFVYSLHSMLSQNAFDSSWVYRSLEKFLFNKDHHIVAVSKEVLQDYEHSIKKSDNSQVISNYVDDKFIAGYRHSNAKQQGILKLVAVGNFKRVKNYEYILEAFVFLKTQQVSLDIYGGGEDAYKQQLQRFIDEHNLPVTLRAQSNNVAALLPGYDLLLLCSKNEGFGMAAVEGMAAGLPLIVSDLPVLRSVTHGNAFFVNLSQPQHLVQVIEDILNDQHDLQHMSRKGTEIVLNNYTKAIYLQKLQSLYSRIMQ